MKLVRHCGKWASALLLAEFVFWSAPPTGYADIVVIPVDMAVTPPGAVNRLTVEVTATYVFIFPITRSDSDSSDVTGNVTTNLGIQFDPVTQEVLSVDELEFTSDGRVWLSGVSLDFDYGAFGAIAMAGTGISGTLDTPNPPGTVTGGNFDAGEHMITLDEGQFVAQGTGTVGGLLDPNPMVFDLAAQPISATGSMTGSLDVSLVSFDHAIAKYDALLTLPINLDERVLDEGGLTVDVAATGMLEATDRFERVFPGISTKLEEAAVGATSFIRGEEDTELAWNLSAARVDGVAEVADGFVDPNDPSNTRQFHVHDADVVATSEVIDVRDFAGIQTSVDVRAWQTSVGFEGSDDVDLSFLVSYDGVNFGQELFFLEVEGGESGGEGSLEETGMVGGEDGPFVTFRSPLGLVPDDVVAVKVVVDMDNDSASEHFFWDNVVMSGIPLSAMSTLTWDGLDNGLWDSTTQWDGGQSGQSPDVTSHVVVPTNTVTVDAGGAAYTLEVASGGEVVVDVGQTLLVGPDLEASNGALDVQGTLDAWSAEIGDSTLRIGPAGTLLLGDRLAMEDTEYISQLGGPACGLVAAAGVVELNAGNTLTVEAIGRLTDSGGGAVLGDLVRTIVTADGAGGIIGTFSSVPEVGDPDANPPSQGTYLGYGVWFGNNKTGQGVMYVGAPGAITAVDVAVFQAKPGDCNGDRSISFADFNDLANNYTGALDPGVGSKEWRQGDFNADADVDFGDFNDLANNYTGAGVEYGPGGPAANTPAGSAKAAAGEASLIVYLANTTGADGVSHVAGDVVLSVDGGEDEPSMRINGYEVYSAAGLLVPDEGGAPYPLIGGAYMEESAAGIVAVSGLTSPLSVSGDEEFMLGWKYDVQAKAAGDLEFSYGTAAGVISGNVLYVVPEPGTLLLLACGGLGLLLWRRRSSNRPSSDPTASSVAEDGSGAPKARWYACS